jgi:hypothetical protein
MMPKSLQHLSVILLAIVWCGCQQSKQSKEVVDDDSQIVMDVVSPDEISDSQTETQDANEAIIPVVIESSGVTAFEEDGTIIIENASLKVVVRMTSGQFDVVAPGGAAYLRNAEARLVMADEGQEPGVIYSTSGTIFEAWTAEPVSDPLGDGLALTVTWRPLADGSPTLLQRLELRGEEAFLLTQLVVPVEDDSPLLGERILRFVPLVADQMSAGGLFVGNDPAAHAIVDNGTDMYLDFVARVFRVGKGNSLFFPPGSVANWNLGLVDSESDASLVAGFMSFRQGVGLVALDYAATESLADEGRFGFTRFEGFNQQEPANTVLNPGDRESGIFYVDFEPKTIFDGLESYASRYAARAGKTIWTDIPTSWNSWGGGSGEGGLGTAINEEIILANLDAMEEDFKPWGMKWFVIDNGWEVNEGTWETNTERFPQHDGMDGMKWMAQEIESRGLIPGIWTAPFWVEKGTKIAVEHPDWIADTTEIGGFLLGTELLTLDLTHPEVLDFIKDHFHMLVHDWGYKWIKLDFSYYTLFNQNMVNPELTAAEAYYNMMQLVRETIGPETFFLTISGMGLGFDMADGGRTTLDNMPTWGDNDDQGTKITLRTAAHRYYLNWLWSNHHDLVYYRPTIGMTLNEARAWTSVFCLMGGIVKIGDPFTMMHENKDALDMARVILPVYPKSARPLDMFELLHPEIYHLSVARGERSWDVLGLFNWGTNVEIMSGKETPEETKTITFNLADVGLDPTATHLLFDSWEHSCRWLDGGLVEETIEPRYERILVVHPKPAEPMVAATSRHLLGGAVEVTEEAIAKDNGFTTLTATLDSPVGHEFIVYVAGAGLALDEVISPADAMIDDSPCDNVLAIRFGAVQSETTLEINFK